MRMKDGLSGRFTQMERFGRRGQSIVEYLLIASLIIGAIVILAGSGGLLRTATDNFVKDASTHAGEVATFVDVFKEDRSENTIVHPH